MNAREKIAVAANALNHIAGTNNFQQQWLTFQQLLLTLDVAAEMLATAAKQTNLLNFSSC